jgi:malonyl-CoA O-methyltransferase
MSNDESFLDRSVAWRSFDLAASTYDSAAALQTEVRGRLLERLDLVTLQPEVVLDLGAGTGHASQALRRRFPRARVIALDIAHGMLRESRHQQRLWRRFDPVRANADALPLANASVDLVFSNLMLQWCDPPDATFAEVRRVLKPRGLFTFTTLGPDTLKELRSAWRAADRHEHVHRFIDMHDIGDALMRARMAEPVMDVEQLTLTFPDVATLTRELKALGATNASKGRNAGLTGRRGFASMVQAYETQRREGTLPATYEVVYGQAWGPIQQPARDGEVRVPMQNISRRKRD